MYTQKANTLSNVHVIYPFSPLSPRKNGYSGRRKKHYIADFPHTENLLYSGLSARSNSSFLIPRKKKNDYDFLLVAFPPKYGYSGLYHWISDSPSLRQ